MQFVFQPLTWGFLLIAVPILVHLINLLRHRKQPWAAMEFLLESYRRNRRWVMLKQWILLASRILAMALLVAMLARWVSASQWLGWFGGRTTHHYLLVDDSYSMSETEQSESCYGRSLRAVNGLVRSISGQPGQHQITLIRWSRAVLATQAGGDQARVDVAADLIAQSIPRDPTRLLDRLSSTQPTSLQLSPGAALDLITPMLSQNRGEQAEVYILSDLRQGEWGDAETMRIKLQALKSSGANIQLIDCAHEPGANLTAASLEPEQEVWAAGVPLMVRFQVRNPSTQVARNVIVKVRTISYPESVAKPQADLAYSGEMVELPSVVIEQIAPGETVTRQVQVLFGLPGQHVVEVALPDDTLMTDNRRWCSIGIQQSQKVLLVDGDVQQANAFFFKTALNPGGNLRTGMSLQTVDAAYLRDAAEEEIATWDVIALLDVPRLDPQAVSKLESFCRSGGGVFVCAGPNTNVANFNEQLYRDGEGIGGASALSISELEQPVGEAEPQISATTHPILEPLTKLSTSPFFLARIRQIVDIDPKSLAAGLTEVVATGPAKRPLVLDKSFGDGHAITLLTGFPANWSNWAQDPTFVVFVLRSMGYLGSFRHPASSQSVGAPIEFVVTDKAVLPEAELLIPSRDANSRTRLQLPIELRENDVAVLRVAIDLDQAQRDLVDSLLRPGVFESWMIDAGGDYLLKNSAHNVAAAEGDLTRASTRELEQKLPVKIRTAEAISGSGLNSQESTHSTLLMALLALLLLGEQALAYSASYHAPRAIAGAIR